MNVRSVRAAAIDTAAVLVLLAAGLVGFGPVFGGRAWIVAAGGGLALGTVLALLAWRVSIGSAGTALGTLLVYFIFGGALADRSALLFGFVPSVGTLAELARGAVFGWKELLTTAPPAGSFDDLEIVPFLTGLLGSVLAVSFAVRAKHPAWALLPAAVVFVVPIAFGTQAAAQPLAQAVVFAAIAIAWYGWRSRTARLAGYDDASIEDEDTRRRVRSRTTTAAAIFGAAVLVLSLVAGTAAAPAEPRRVLRDEVTPPFDVHSLASPLAAYRHLITDEKDTVLFTVSGLPKGTPIRLATLDGYDGMVYAVAAAGVAGSGSFARVGQRIPAVSSGTPATLRVTVKGLGGDWMPDAGYATALSFRGKDATTLNRALSYNVQTGTAVEASGLPEGASYTLQTVIPATPSEKTLLSAHVAQLALPQLSGVPDAAGEDASKWTAGVQGDFAKLKALETKLSHDGFYSDGQTGEAPSRAGHGEERIGTMLTATQLIGDDEQYAVAMALMARKLNLPARVVMGFTPTGSGTVSVTGADLHAWVEVDFAGIGWVSFTPTPPTSQKPQAEAPKPKPQPNSQVVQPPPPPQEPQTLPATSSSASKSPKDKKAADAARRGHLLLVAGATTGGALLVLLVLLGPAVLIGALKARRRMRRRSAEREADRLSGGWDELIDRAGDLGHRVGPGGTRREAAQALAPALGSETLIVAERADAGVFGPAEPSESEVERLWAEVDALVRSARGRAGFWGRLRARLSVRSLRRSRR